MKARFRYFFLFLSACMMTGGVNASPSYPTRPVAIVVANPPGGQTDVITRLIAHQLSIELGQPFIVENKPGASSDIGPRYVAQSEPDGYTLIATAINNFGANPAIIRDMPFDPIKDFKMIVQTVSTTNILVVNVNSPFHSLQDILKFARANPGKLTYGSAGLGSSLGLFMEMMKSMAKVNILNVPYRGSAPADTDLMGGRISMIFDTMPAVWPLVQAKKLRAIAVSSAQRSPIAPDVPTMAESGLANFAATSWLGLAAPAGTPDRIIQVLNRAVNEALKASKVRDQIIRMGSQPAGGTSAHFQTFVEHEVSTWKEILSNAGIKPS